MQPWVNLSSLDRPELLQFIFYPRREHPSIQTASNIIACSIPVDKGVSITSRFYVCAAEAPNVLYFHGNGEIAQDYDDIGLIYNERIGVNLFIADYRGYGGSDGRPSCAAMLQDAHPVFEGFKNMLKGRGFKGSLFIMGRSLGSLSAIELAFHYGSQLRGLIVESGFIDVLSVFKYVGVMMDGFSPDERKALSGIENLRTISIPALILHGEYDHIVPCEQAKALYEAIASTDKKLVIIPGVDHNTIFMGGMEQYLRELRGFVDRYIL